MNSNKKIARITLDLPLDLQKKLKTIAALQGKTMRAVIIQSLENEFTVIKETTQQSIEELGL